MNVSAVVVTRGDVDLAQTLWNVADSPAVNEILVWRNGEALVRYEVRRPYGDGSFALVLDREEKPRPDIAVYGRYAALEHASNPVAYVQDDDCVTDVLGIIAAYEPGRLVANMPRSRWDDYPDSTLVGWGAVFDRDLPRRAFDRFLGRYEGTIDEWFFWRTCDVVFSALTPRTVVDVGFQHLPWAEDPARAMFKQPGHKEERDRMLELARAVRQGSDDDRR